MSPCHTAAIGTRVPGTGFAGVFLLTFALAASPAFATETIGSSQAGDSTQAGPCGQATCVLFQDTAPSGSVTTPSASGQVTDITIKKTAGALNIQPVIISPAAVQPTYTLESIGSTIALDPAAGNVTYPLATPLAIDPGDTVGIRYPDGAAPADPKLYNNDPANGGSMTRIGNTAAGPSRSSTRAAYPFSARFANYNMNFKFTVTTATVAPSYDLIARAGPPAKVTIDVYSSIYPHFQPDGNYALPASIYNEGPETSEPTSATHTSSGMQGLMRPEPDVDCTAPEAFATTAFSITCQIPAITDETTHQPGWNPFYTDTNRDVLAWGPFLPLTVSYGIDIVCNPKEATCENNKASSDLTFVAAPRTGAVKADKEGVEGKAEPVGEGGGEIVEVDVAILKAIEGLEGLDGEFTDNPFERAKKDCLWLKNKQAKFAKSDPDGKTCGEPVWLDAKGTEKWNYELKKDLPPGEYVAYARATSNEGASGFVFTKKGGNRKEFKVKK